MNVLALDTCMRACSAALTIGSDEGAPTFSVYEDRDRGHAEALMPMVEKVMGEAGLDYAALDKIAVTIGPGTFTGVRVGVSAARGLALATGAALVGASSLEVIAARALERMGDEPAPLAVATDARRGQVYFAAYKADLTPICEPSALSPDAAAEMCSAAGIAVAVGSGSALLTQAGGNVVADSGSGDLQPHAATLARLAVRRAPSGETVSPLYLRPPDAKPQTGAAVPHR